MSEKRIMTSIMVAVSRAGAVVFRNNVGQAWIGKSKVYRETTKVVVRPGDVVVRSARRFHAGLCKGSSDLIGLTPVIIRPEHVGQQIAVFTAIEVKDDDGRVTPEQAHFVEQMEGYGGIAAVVWSDAEAVALIKKFES